MIVDEFNLSDVLQQLSKLGQPTLGIYGHDAKGWHASLNLPAPAGCKAAVASEFGCRTPEAAVQQVIDRLEALRGQTLREQAANPRLRLVKQA